MNRREAVRSVMLESANDNFAWGRLDCCQFAAKVAEKITGKDYSKGFQYLNEDDAALIINSKGGLTELVTGILSAEPVDVDQLELGDPVIVSLPVIGDTLGVYAIKWVLCKSQNGTLTINNNRITKGWSLATSTS